jgi:hypothetical protein
MKTLKRKIWGSFGHWRRRRGKDIKKAKIEMEEVETKERVIDKGGNTKEDKDIVVKIEMEEVETKEGVINKGAKVKEDNFLT